MRRMEGLHPSACREMIHHDWGGVGKGLRQQTILQSNLPEWQRRWRGIPTALYGQLFAHKLVTPHWRIGHPSQLGNPHNTQQLNQGRLHLSPPPGLWTYITKALRGTFRAVCPELMTASCGKDEVTEAGRYPHCMLHRFIAVLVWGVDNICNSNVAEINKHIYKNTWEVFVWMKDAFHMCSLSWLWSKQCVVWPLPF